MKWKSLLILLLFFQMMRAQPPLIHAHNDYQQPEPLTNALRHKAYSIEADVYLVNDTLRVAHDKKESATAPSLHALYIQPIVNSFSRNKGCISGDNKYSPVLMIDIKENGEAVLNNLIKELGKYRKVFDRSANALAIRIVISGDRGPLTKWKSYPSFIMFDGRPDEMYDKATLQKVAFISNSYANYSFITDSIDVRLIQLVRQVHAMKKLLRLWGTPDNSESWDHLYNLGVDIINTDKVEECRKYFATKVR